MASYDSYLQILVKGHARLEPDRKWIISRNLWGLHQKSALILFCSDSRQVNSHVFEHNRIRTDDELKTFLPAWGAQKYVPDCPLWAVMLVRLDKGRCAIVTKYHHMLGDGVSFMRLLEYLCDGGWVHLQTAPVKSMSPLHWAYAWFTFPWNALKSYRLARIRKGFRPNSNKSSFTKVQRYY